MSCPVLKGHVFKGGVDFIRLVSLLEIMCDVQRCLPLRSSEHVYNVQGKDVSLGRAGVDPEPVLGTLRVNTA